MTDDEARAEAVRLGALQPRGFIENAAATWIENTQGRRWSDTAKAQERLELWTKAILAGKNPKTSTG
jgi:hypothetical protein